MWVSRDPIEENGGWNLYGMLGNKVIDLYDSLGNGDSRPIPGTHETGHGPEVHSPKGKTHAHVDGYNRQIFPDGKQRPHGSGGKDKDIPKKILEKALKFFFKNRKCPVPMILPIPWFLLDPNAFKEEPPLTA